MSVELQHLHLRKRVSHPNVCEPFPARSLKMRLLDHLMYAVAILSPLALFPQAFRVFVEGDVGGLSLLTWLLLSAGNLLWLTYGLVHREKQIILANGITFVFNLSIVIGILKYS